MIEKKCSVCSLLQEGYRKWCRDCGFLFPEETLSSIWGASQESTQEGQMEEHPLDPASETIYGVPVALLLESEEPQDIPNEMLVPDIDVDDSEAPTELWTRPTKRE